MPSISRIIAGVWPTGRTCQPARSKATCREKRCWARGNKTCMAQRASRVQQVLDERASWLPDHRPDGILPTPQRPLRGHTECDRVAQKAEPLTTWQQPRSLDACVAAFGSAPRSTSGSRRPRRGDCGGDGPRVPSCRLCRSLSSPDPGEDASQRRVTRVPDSYGCSGV